MKSTKNLGYLQKKISKIGALEPPKFTWAVIVRQTGRTSVSLMTENVNIVRCRANCHCMGLLESIFVIFFSIGLKFHAELKF